MKGGQCPFFVMYWTCPYSDLLPRLHKSAPVLPMHCGSVARKTAYYFLSLLKHSREFIRDSFGDLFWL